MTITGADNSPGANQAAKVMSLPAGMVGGMDSSEDVDRLRHASHSLVFDGMRGEVGWERDGAAGPRPGRASSR